MSVVGDFTVPASAFALEHALSAVPEMTVEADRLASHSTMEVLPFVWATGTETETARRALEEDSTVRSVTVADEMDGEALYRLEWVDEFCGLIDDMVDHHAVIMEAKAHDGRWQLRLRFAEEQMVSSFQDHFRERGHRFEVNHLVHPTEPRQREFRLTAEQHEALVAAARSGYFSVPRAISMDELGETLGISANSVSERIRRGVETLVHSALVLDDADERRE